MSRSLTAKQRAIAFQNWCSLIIRESRDLDSLDRIVARALHDRELSADGQLQTMVQAELGRRRSELQREQQQEEQGDRSPKPPSKRRAAPTRHDDPARQTSPDFAPRTRPKPRPVRQERNPSPPDQEDVAYGNLRRLGKDLGVAIGGADEDAARVIWEQMQTLHENSDGVISASALEPYRRRIERLHFRLREFRVQIDTMARDALTAAQCGNADAAAKRMRRLIAIHLTHPRLLGEPRLETIRQEIADADEGHEDRLTTRRLIERERTVVAELKQLAAAVSEFYRIVCALPKKAAEFRRAEDRYRQVLHDVRLHEKDWLAEFVLELADVLAEWSVPPPDAEQQIDRFIERVRVGIGQVRKTMAKIDTGRETSEKSV